MDKPVDLTKLITEQAKELKKRALFRAAKALDEVSRLSYPEAAPFDEEKVKREISDIVEGK